MEVNETQEPAWFWMQRALELAERGRGFVEPNPLVGAVVVRDGLAMGEGWHERYGAAHAEVNALAAAGDAARGATLYVTLEPCCHQGKTPPCTDAIIRAGIGRVVAAMLDPFPQVSGQGVARLRSSGIDVDLGLGEDETRRLNAPYLKLTTTGRPYVHAKWAMSLDGKIATRTGDSKWISNRSSRQYVHALRGQMDAIVVGSGTALADDPLLTARPAGARVPVRVVMMGRRRLDPECRLLGSVAEAPILIATRPEESDAHRQYVHDKGVEVLALPNGDRPDGVRKLLDELGRRRMTNILVEGGSTLLGSFFDAGEIDEVHVFIAPRLVGGLDARTPMGGRGIEKIIEALSLTDVEIERIDDDLLVHARAGKHWPATRPAPR